MNEVTTTKSKPKLSDEELRKLTKPAVPHDLLVSAVSEYYGRTTVIQQLDSYDDCNFLIEIDSTKYLLKIHNGVESADYIRNAGTSKIAFANALYRHVSSNGLRTNVIFPVQNKCTVTITPQSIVHRIGDDEDDKVPVSCFLVKEGDDVALHEFPVSSTAYYSSCVLAMQVFSWVEGTTMSSARALPIETIAKAGVFLGRLCGVLDDLPQPIPQAAHRYHAWNTMHTANLRSFISWIQDDHRRSMVESIIHAFENEILPNAHKFCTGVIHGDFNDANILLDDGNLNVVGVIDFGDSTFSWRIVDLSVGMAYAMLSAFEKTKHSLAAAAAMLRGFHSVYPVTNEERKHLRLLIACRLALSCTFGAFSLRQNPDNLYLLLHSEPAWEAMELIWSHGCDAAAIDKLFDAACSKISHFETVPQQTKTQKEIDCSDICVSDLCLLSPAAIKTLSSD